MYVLHVLVSLILLQLAVSRDIVVLLYASTSATNGIVRVRVNGSPDPSSSSAMTHTICWGGNWGIANANVTCRQMGFLKATSYQAKTSGALRSVIDNVRCTGNETNIADCSYSLSGTCTAGKHVDVTCLKNPAFDGLFDIRLNGKGSAANKGVVEVRAKYEKGTNRPWFAQCYNLWSTNNSKVVCKQLGYIGAKTTRGIIGNPSDVAGGEIRCTGTEQTLRNCTVIPTNSCTNKRTHPEVECVLDTGTQQRFDVRLSYENESKGTVELLRYGRWGIICDLEWEIKSARVVCQQLGFIDVIRVTKAAEFGQGNGPIYLRHPECKGNEWSLEVCPRRYDWGGGLNPCQTKDTAGVVCNSTKFPSYDISTTITTDAAESTGRFFLHSPAFPKLFSYDSSTHLVCIMTADTTTEFSLYIHYKMFQNNHQETLSFQAGDTQVSSSYFYFLKLYGDNSNPGPYTTKTHRLSMEFKSNGAKGMGKFRVEIRVPNDTAVTLNCSMVATTLAPPTTTTVVTSQGNTPTSVTNSQTTAHETTMSKATTQTNPTKGQGHSSTDKSTDKSTTTTAATITTGQTTSGPAALPVYIYIIAIVIPLIIIIVIIVVVVVVIKRRRKAQASTPMESPPDPDDSGIFEMDNKKKAKNKKKRISGNVNPGFGDVDVKGIAFYNEDDLEKPNSPGPPQKNLYEFEKPSGKARPPNGRDSVSFEPDGSATYAVVDKMRKKPTPSDPGHGPDSNLYTVVNKKRNRTENGELKTDDTDGHSNAGFEEDVPGANGGFERDEPMPDFATYSDVNDKIEGEFQPSFDTYAEVGAYAAKIQLDAAPNDQVKTETKPEKQKTKKKDKADKKSKSKLNPFAKNKVKGDKSKGAKEFEFSPRPHAYDDVDGLSPNCSPYAQVELSTLPNAGASGSRSATPVVADENQENVYNRLNFPMLKKGAASFGHKPRSQTYDCVNFDRPQDIQIENPYDGYAPALPVRNDSVDIDNPYGVATEPGPTQVQDGGGNYEQALPVAENSGRAVWDDGPEELL